MAEDDDNAELEREVEEQLVEQREALAGVEEALRDGGPSEELDEVCHMCVNAMHHVTCRAQWHGPTHVTTNSACDPCM